MDSYFDTALKLIWKTGFKPTSANFNDLLYSFENNASSIVEYNKTLSSTSTSKTIDITEAFDAPGFTLKDYSFLWMQLCLAFGDNSNTSVTSIAWLMRSTFETHAPLTSACMLDMNGIIIVIPILMHVTYKPSPSTYTLTYYSLVPLNIHHIAFLD